jgi:hypothetical protein
MKLYLHPPIRISDVVLTFNFFFFAFIEFGSAVFVLRADFFKINYTEVRKWLLTRSSEKQK